MAGEWVPQEWKPEAPEYVVKSLLRFLDQRRLGLASRANSSRNNLHLLGPRDRPEEHSELTPKPTQQFQFQMLERGTLVPG